MTALGNTIINAFVVLYASLVSNIPVTDQLKFKFEGDDSVTFVNSMDVDIVDKVIESLKTIGFKVKSSIKCINKLTKVS